MSFSFLSGYYFLYDWIKGQIIHSRDPTKGIDIFFGRLMLLFRMPMCRGVIYLYRIVRRSSTSLTPGADQAICTASNNSAQLRTFPFRMILLP